MNNPRPTESVALTKARAEVGTLTADQRRTIAEAAGIWSAEWSTLEKLPAQDLELAARLIIQAFPDFSPIEMTKYFTLLGGKFYETGEFWMHQATQHPDYRGAELVTIEPDTEDWRDYIGARQDPAAIAAAVKCIGRRAQRGGMRIEVEASYVSIDDPIISAYDWANLGTGSRGDAEKRAKEQIPEGTRYEVIWKKARDGNPGEWLGKIVKLKPDAFALALKKARTTATRRCLRRLFSLNEARVVSTLAAVNKRLDRGLEDRNENYEVGIPVAGGAMLKGRFPTNMPDVMPRDPIDTFDPEGAAAAERKSLASNAVEQPITRDPNEARARPRPETPAAPRATSSHDEEAARKAKQVSEEDRRKMYTWLDGRDISVLGVEDDHEALKVLLREIRGLQPAEPVSTTTVTYLEYEELARRCEQLPAEKKVDNPLPFSMEEPAS